MRLDGKTVVLLIADGYFEHEYFFPYYRFKEEGAKVITAGLTHGVVYGEGNNGRDGLAAEVEIAAADLNVSEIDILFLVGGVYGPLFLRVSKDIQVLVRECFKLEKLVCSICHAPWILISADVLKGRKISCPHDMAPDVIGAGAEYIRNAVVADGNLLSAGGQRLLPEMFRELFKTYYS